VSENTALFIACLMILFAWLYTMRSKEKSQQEERNLWHKERQMLLDRIQAPTFTDYTNKVVREKKAEQPEEPKVDYGEFIS
jgi:type IV secretory pathway VirB4 component